MKEKILEAIGLLEEIEKAVSKDLGPEADANLTRAHVQQVVTLLATDVEVRMRRLEIKPGEILVLSFMHKLSQEAVQRCKDTLQNIVPGSKVIILEEGAELQVISPVQQEKTI